MTSAVFAWFSSSVFGTEGFGEVGDEVPGFLVAHGNILGVGSEEEALGGISPSWRSRSLGAGDVQVEVDDLRGFQ